MNPSFLSGYDHPKITIYVDGSVDINEAKRLLRNRIWSYGYNPKSFDFNLCSKIKVAGILLWSITMPLSDVRFDEQTTLLS